MTTRLSTRLAITLQLAPALFNQLVDVAPALFAQLAGLAPALLGISDDFGDATLAPTDCVPWRSLKTVV